ncbi:MAG TPA: TlpA disulfide reductase family protein [Methylomirabilota bacterium]|nr:TlpA disulfide reductase family protein [Methylomirabilota bacterium]
MNTPIGLALLAAALLLPAAASAQDPAAALALIKPTPIRPAKDFQVATPDKKQVRLSDFKGKVVFLNFWATWCKPCEEEMPAMERLYRAYKNRGLVVLAISEDSEGAPVVPFVKKHELTFPIGLDPKQSVAGLYGIFGIPATFIIDRKGDRLYYANGPREWDSKPSRALFESLLK